MLGVKTLSDEYLKKQNNYYTLSTMSRFKSFVMKTLTLCLEYLKLSYTITKYNLFNYFGIKQ